MKRSFAFVALLLLSISATAIVSTSYKPLARIGPYYTTTDKYDATTGGQVGGYVTIYKNGADTLLVGDLVYISAQNTVLKSGTLANYNTLAGVVVGGTKTNMRGVTSAPAATDTAAYAGQPVLVLSEGRTWVKVDTTTGGIAAGALIMPSLVSGKVKAKAATIDSLFRVVGRMIDSSAVSVPALAHISIK